MEGLSEYYIDDSNDVMVSDPSSNFEDYLSSDIVDNDPPIISVKQKTYKIKANDKIDLLDGVKAFDKTDGDLTDRITTNIDELDFSHEGIKKVEYNVIDNSGNVGTETVYVTVKKDNTNLVRFGQLGIFIVSLLIIVFIYKYIRSIRIEKRFSKYTLNSSKNSSISLFDNLYTQYKKFLRSFERILSKSTFIKKKATRYDKYTTAFDIESSINFIAKKIMLGFAFTFFVVVAELLQSKLANIFEMLIAFIVGFYLLNVVYLYKYNQYKKKLENDMLEAISIMNNAFKAGMSIMQAIKLVSKEIKGPISKEFTKVSNDISMGLDIEVAFKRFSSRVKSNEAMYLTSSLSVLNKTGGNIINVFTSIEKNMFNRKKLDNELKSLTSSSKLVMYVLMIVPPLFIIFISLINKDYFEPLLNNPIGILILCLITIIYIAYIFVIRKVLKINGIR